MRSHVTWFAPEHGGRMRQVGLVLSFVAVLAVTGCASDDILSEIESDVDVTSSPGFLEEAQVDEDTISNCELAGVQVDPDSVRYQGEWNGDEIYLGVVGGSSVFVVTVDPSVSGSCFSGGTSGNSIVGTGDPTDLWYLPQGTVDVPDGWLALSDWVIVKG